MLQWQATTS